jgi:hypothetical protein
MKGIWGCSLGEITAAIGAHFCRITVAYSSGQAGQWGRYGDCQGKRAGPATQTCVMGKISFKILFGWAFQKINKFFQVKIWHNAILKMRQSEKPAQFQGAFFSLYIANLACLPGACQGRGIPAHGNDLKFVFL